MVCALETRWFLYMCFAPLLGASALGIQGPRAERLALMELLEWVQGPSSSRFKASRGGSDCLTSSTKTPRRLSAKGYRKFPQVLPTTEFKEQICGLDKRSQ